MVTPDDSPRPVARLRVDVKDGRAIWVLDRRPLLEVLNKYGSDAADTWTCPSAEDVLPPSRHMWGEPGGEWAHLDRESQNYVGLLTCGECGFPECSAVIADITFTDQFVSWSRFRHGTAARTRGDRRPSLGDIPTIHFGRLQYDRALTGAAP
jgi:hypothetical protein